MRVWLWLTSRYDRVLAVPRFPSLHSNHNKSHRLHPRRRRKSQTNKLSKTSSNSNTVSNNLHASLNIRPFPPTTTLMDLRPLISGLVLKAFLPGRDTLVCHTARLRQDGIPLQIKVFRIKDTGTFHLPRCRLVLAIIRASRPLISNRLHPIYLPHPKSNLRPSKNRPTNQSLLSSYQARPLHQLLQKRCPTVLRHPQNPSLT